MEKLLAKKKLWIGCGIGVAALAVALAIDDPAAGIGAAEPYTAGYAVGPDGSGGQDRPGTGAEPSATPGQGDARMALAGLTQIRQQQCQSGNQLACQALPEMPGIERQLIQLEQQCGSGDRSACERHAGLARKISVAYQESAAVMEQGAAAMARMDAWRGQMNRNAAASMDALRARGAAGQAAHADRQATYAAQNRSWEAGQASSDRTQGRYIDGIYEGTTMDGGGVQSRVPYGSTGYTDGRGNVIAVPNGGRAPDGWQEMTPTHAVPQ